MNGPPPEDVLLSQSPDPSALEVCWIVDDPAWVTDA